MAMMSANLLLFPCVIDSSDTEKKIGWYHLAFVLGLLKDFVFPFYVFEMRSPLSLFTYSPLNYICLSEASDEV